MKSTEMSKSGRRQGKTGGKTGVTSYGNEDFPASFNAACDSICHLGRYIGVDYGAKRIGLAISDPANKMALPIDKIDNTPDLITRLKKRLDDYDIAALVVGLPLNRNKEATRQTQVVLEFCEKLKKAVSFPVILHDESYSTKAATHQLHETGLSNKSSRHKHIDSLAAAFMLQGFLDKN